MRAEPEAGVAVLVHELTHALGFTDDMFDKFIDPSGQPIPKSQVRPSEPLGARVSPFVARGRQVAPDLLQVAHLRAPKYTHNSRGHDPPTIPLVLAVPPMAVDITIRDVHHIYVSIWLHGNAVVPSR